MVADGLMKALGPECQKRLTAKMGMEICNDKRSDREIATMRNGSVGGVSSVALCSPSVSSSIPWEFSTPTAPTAPTDIVNPDGHWHRPSPAGMPVNKLSDFRNSSCI